jgi:hypothetical protein
MAELTQREADTSMMLSAQVGAVAAGCWCA